MTIGLICGGGVLPVAVVRALVTSGQQFCVAHLAGEADGMLELPENTPSQTFGWGQIGGFLNFLKRNHVTSVLAVGGITKRPDFSALKLDMGAIKLLPKLAGIMRGGDDHVLHQVGRIFEENGLTVASVLDVVPELACPIGPLTKRIPKDVACLDMDLAFQAAKAAGQLDMGQGAIAANGRVIGVEGPEGTQGLIARAGELKDSHRARWSKQQGVLAKRPKPNQDLRFDLPVVGPDTIDQIANASLAGIALEAGKVLLLDRAELIARADRRGIFVIGLPSS